MNQRILNEVVETLMEQFPRLSAEDTGDGDTYEIQLDSRCSVVLAYEDAELHIRNLSSRGGGSGTTAVTSLTEYAQENDLTLIAKKVLPTAISFWDKMGFERIGLTEDFMLV